MREQLLELLQRLNIPLTQGRNDNIGLDKTTEGYYHWAEFTNGKILIKELVDHQNSPNIIFETSNPYAVIRFLKSPLEPAIPEVDNLHEFLQTTFDLYKRIPTKQEMAHYQAFQKGHNWILFISPWDSPNHIWEVKTFKTEQEAQDEVNRCDYTKEYYIIRANTIVGEFFRKL